MDTKALSEHRPIKAAAAPSILAIHRDFSSLCHCGWIRSLHSTHSSLFLWIQVNVRPVLAQQTWRLVKRYTWRSGGMVPSCALTVICMLQHSGTHSYRLLIFFETTLSTGECIVMLTAVYLSVGLVWFPLSWYVCLQFVLSWSRCPTGFGVC